MKSTDETASPEQRAGADPMQPASPESGLVRKAPIALQMWSVREDARRDFPAALRQIAALGYAGVEHVHSLGYGGLPAREVRVLLEELGLGTAGGHVELTEWEADTEGILAYHRELEARHVAVSWVQLERRRDQAAYLQMAQSLRTIAARCRDEGLQLVYHHHDFEFVRFDGQYALDLLLERVGPELLQVEVDVHWVARGGDNPVAYLRKVSERCPLVHFKDLNPAWAAIQDHADPRPFTEVGTGAIDFPAVARAAAHAQWWIVEQDFCSGSPWESARRSLENLQKLGLA
jgi:sugar phosphate isomerase/epimerase